MGKTSLGFHYRGTAGNPRDARCELFCEQCHATTEAGERCRLRTCIGLHYCHIHCRQKLHLCVRPSKKGGLGLFACGFAPGKGFTDSYVMEGGDKAHYKGVICEYNGVRLTEQQVRSFYGSAPDLRMPYGIMVGGKHVEDGACRRGLGALANDYREFYKSGRVLKADPSAQNAELHTCRFANGDETAVIRVKRGCKISNGQEILVDYGMQAMERVQADTQRRPYPGWFVEAGDCWVMQSGGDERCKCRNRR